MHAKYTVVLKDIMENEQTKPLLNKSLSTYPLYKQQADVETIIPEREELNRRLLNHYKYREIGFETVGRFMDELEITMCEIMPYYNEMYKTIEIMAELDNPFDNVDFTETYKETRSGTQSNELARIVDDTGDASTSNTSTSNDSGTSTSTVNSNSKNVHSETPQNSLSITADNINSVDYADDVTWNKSNSEDTTTTSNEGETISSTETSQTNKTTTDETGTLTTSDTVEHTFTKKGNQGVNTYAHDMNEFRTSIIDVTNMIINDKRIQELFMLVY